MGEANQLLNEWIERLGLQEWRIKLNVNCTEEETEGNSGLTIWQETNMTACINIVDEKYYGDDRVVPFDFEKTLVHELLHLKTCFLTDSGNELQDRVGHQMIDSISRALVDAKRCRTTLKE